MNLSKHLFFIALLLALTTQAWAEPDTRAIGTWVSTSGAKIGISFPDSYNDNLVHLSINGGAPIRAALEGGDMDSFSLTYKSGGSLMRAHFNPMTKIITVYDGDKEYSTWKKR